MYRCESCGEVSAPGELINRVVVATREVVYPLRTRPAKQYNQRAKIIDKGGQGRETVKEMVVCRRCVSGG